MLRLLPTASTFRLPKGARLLPSRGGAACRRCYPIDMVDIHCHILPELDDGAVAPAVSQAMAEMAIEDGITHLVATPHSNYRYQFDPAVNRHKRDTLQTVV